MLDIISEQSHSIDTLRRQIADVNGPAAMHSNVIDSVYVNYCETSFCGQLCFCPDCEHICALSTTCRCTVVALLFVDEYTEFGCYGTVLSLLCSGQNVIQVNAPVSEGRSADRYILYFAVLGPGIA